MLIITYIIAFLVAVMILVSLHEFGHFIVAKVLGIKVLRFSIGFGKTLWRRQGKDGTEYVIAMLPLGGYVKMLDESEGNVVPEEAHRAFNRQGVLKRAAVIIAGPLMNLLFAIVAFWLIFSIGVNQAKPIIGKVIPNSIAGYANLQTGDEIIQIDKQQVSNWQDAVIAVVSRIGDAGTMEVVVHKPNNSKPQSYSLLLSQWQLNSLKPDPLESLGIKPYTPPMPPIIGKVKSNSPAANSGLQLGDKIISYNNTPVNDWIDLLEFIHAHPNQQIQLEIQRQGKLQPLTLQIGSTISFPFKRIGYLGVAPEKVTWPPGMQQPVKYSLLGAWVPAYQETWQLLRFNFIMVGKLITGKISLQSLGGPIMIMQSANAAFLQGLVIYITFLGFLSVMLAFVNLLPIPTLDGGHFIYLLIEGITGKPVSLAVQYLTMRIGLIILVLLIFNATVNDIMRLF